VPRRVQDAVERRLPAPVVGHHPAGMASNLHCECACLSSFGRPLGLAEFLRRLIRSRRLRAALHPSVNDHLTGHNGHAQRLLANGTRTCPTCRATAGGSDRVNGPRRRALSLSSSLDWDRSRCGTIRRSRVGESTARRSAVAHIRGAEDVKRPRPPSRKRCWSMTLDPFSVLHILEGQARRPFSH